MSYKTKSNPWRPPIDLRGELTAVELQHLRCLAGEHDVAVVPAHRVVYAPGGGRRQTGERFYRYCQCKLADPVKRPRTGSHRPGPDTEGDAFDARSP